MVLFLESRLLRFSARGVVGTSRTTVGDMVVVLQISGNWEDSSRCLRQRDRNHGDLQRGDSAQVNRGPIMLVKESTMSA
jgi:hypothetical protein